MKRQPNQFHFFLLYIRLSFKVHSEERKSKVFKNVRRFLIEYIVTLFSPNTELPKTLNHLDPTSEGGAPVMLKATCPLKTFPLENVS